MPSILAPAPDLVGPPAEDLPPSNAGTKALVLGSLLWIVVVIGTAHVVDKARGPRIEAEEPPTESTVPLSVSERAPSVYFANPFDSSEVFEFPPGTSSADARAAVAEFLIDRARGRVAGFQHATRVAAITPGTAGDMPTGH